MKKQMKKSPSKTDDLLKRLGASLKESPLNAHARGQGMTQAQVAQVAGVKASAGMQEVKSDLRTNTAAASATMGPGSVNSGKSEGQRMREANAAVGTPWVETQSRGEGLQKEELKKVVAVMAGEETLSSERIFRKPAAKSAVMANEKISENETGASKSFAADMAEGINEMMIKTAAPLTAEQVETLQAAPAEVKGNVKMQGGAPTAESLQTTLKNLGMPMNERQVAQLKELQTMREAIAELKKLQSQTRPAPAAAAPTAPQWQNYAGGSQRQTQSGWKTSTIGLYPEDYEKAYELMNYLRAQTGQAVNLSRVIKIALRAMEVGPEVLQINEQIRAKDGRLLSRR